MKKVLYISMPFASVSWGSLALGTLKAIGQQEKISADIRYLNIPFAIAIGEERYNTLRELGDAEICFTSALFPEESPGHIWEQYLAIYKGDRNGRVIAGARDQFLEIARRQAPGLLDHAISEIPWEDYDIVGFTTGYHQLTASLAMAARIRSRYPQKIIILGGASCEGKMGPALLNAFDFLDVVVSGEADTVIVPLIQQLRKGVIKRTLPGVHVRWSQRITAEEPSLDMVSRASTPTSSPQDHQLSLDTLPVPDYHDYFQQIAEVRLQDDIRIPFESSRGCWWGQKRPCTFCGLNGDTISYRSKSADKVLAEVRTQYQRHGIKRFLAVDNILNLSFFGTLLPGLQTMHEKHGITLFYETKSCLHEKQIKALRKAGVTEIQPGIESFSDRILKLMRKGSNGLNQVRFLRDCESHGIETRYGILWGNPGETANDYLQMVELIPFLWHLPPPKYVAPVRLQRFSPYFLAPEKYGMRAVSPAPIYRVMFSDRELDYMNIAYNFQYEQDFDYDQDLKQAIERLMELVEEWKSKYQKFLLISTELNGTLYIADRRGPSLTVLRLSGLVKKILAFCGKPRGQRLLLNKFSSTPGAAMAPILEELVSRRLLLRWNQYHSSVGFLSLPVRVSNKVFDEQALRSDLSKETLPFAWSPAPSGATLA